MSDGHLVPYPPMCAYCGAPALADPADLPYGDLAACCSDACSILHAHRREGM